MRVVVKMRESGINYDEMGPELKEAMDRRLIVLGEYLAGVNAVLMPPVNEWEMAADDILFQPLVVMLKQNINERLDIGIMTKEQRRLLLKTLEVIDERAASFKERRSKPVSH